MTTSFHWDDVRVFLAIARAGTLSGAAESMNIGIATLSRRLERLEQTLGMPLFSRHQSGYRLTDDGEALLGRAEALEYAGTALAEQARLQEEVSGKVKLATSDNLASYFVIPSMSTLLERYPALQLDVVTGIQSVNLQRRDADLAIRMVRPEAGHLTLKRLGSLGFGVYAAQCYLDQHPSSRGTEADYISWGDSHQHLPAAQWVTRKLRGKPTRLSANTLTAQLSAVRAGLGLAVLPHFMARQHHLYCLEADIGVNQDIWLVMHSDLAASRRVRVVADHLISLFSEINDQLLFP